MNLIVFVTVLFFPTLCVLCVLSACKLSSQQSRVEEAAELEQHGWS